MSDANEYEYTMKDVLSRTKKDPQDPSIMMFEAGVRQAVEWLRADYPYGEGPDWREHGAEWIAERLAEWRKGEL